jgi:hypothetical protein
MTKPPKVEGDPSPYAFFKPDVLFQLTQDWPLPWDVVPAGTVLGGFSRLSDGAMVEGPYFRGKPVPLPLPMCAMALSQAGADHLAQAYPNELHLLRVAPGLKLHQFLATNNPESREYIAERQREALADAEAQLVQMKEVYWPDEPGKIYK